MNTELKKQAKELAKYFEVPYKAEDRRWCLQQAALIRSLVAEIERLEKLLRDKYLWEDG